MKLTMYGRGHRKLEADHVISFTTEPATDLGDAPGFKGGAMIVDVVYADRRGTSFTQVFKVVVE